MRPPRPLIRESNLAMLVDRPGSVALRALRGQEA
jgi:hypothetical protein